MRSCSGGQRRDATRLAGVLSAHPAMAHRASLGRARTRANGGCRGMNTATDALLEFVNRELLRDSPHRVGPDTPLFADGLVDSLKILQLIAYIEMKTSRSIPD